MLRSVTSQPPNLTEGQGFCQSLPVAAASVRDTLHPTPPASALVHAHAPGSRHRRSLQPRRGLGRASACPSSGGSGQHRRRAAQEGRRGVPGGPGVTFRAAPARRRRLLRDRGWKVVSITSHAWFNQEPRQNVRCAATPAAPLAVVHGRAPRGDRPPHPVTDPPCGQRWQCCS